MKTEQIKDFYTDDSSVYDDRWVKKGGRYTNESQIEIVRSLTSGWENRNLLEIGCGSGRFSVILAKANPDMVFMDLSDAMLEVTLQKVGHSFKGVNASVYQIPLPSKSIDGLVSINVFNHIEDLEKAFSEINRVLVEDGELVINFANLYSYFFLAGTLVNFRQESIGRQVFSRWANPKIFLSLLENHGFEIVEQVGNVFVPIYLDIPVIREILIVLDKVTTRSFFRSIAPAMFVKCKKVRNVAEA